MNPSHQYENRTVTINDMTMYLQNEFENDDEWIGLNITDITRIFISLQKLKMIKRAPMEPIRWDEDSDEYEERCKQSNWEYKLA